MTTAYQQVLPLNTIKLPKLISSRNFRIRSASKDKLKEETASVKTQRKSPKEIFFSNTKKTHRRTSSMNSTKSKKSKTKKSQPNCSEEQQNNLELKSKIVLSHLKTEIKQSQQTLQFDRECQKSKLDDAAKIFDPKTIMKMGRHNREHSHEESSLRNSKNKGLKGSLRMKQFMYEQNKPKTRKKKYNQNISEEADEFWRKVNESLILTPKINDQEVSKDLREIYENFVTQ